MTRRQAWVAEGVIATAALAGMLVLSLAIASLWLALAACLLVASLALVGSYLIHAVRERPRLVEGPGTRVECQSAEGTVDTLSGKPTVVMPASLVAMQPLSPAAPPHVQQFMQAVQQKIAQELGIPPEAVQVGQPVFFGSACTTGTPVKLPCQCRVCTEARAMDAAFEGRVAEIAAGWKKKAGL